MARALHSGFDDGSNTDARRVSLDTENFTENLSDHDTNVQEALESLDKLKYVSSDFFLSKLKDVDDTNKEPNTMITVDLNNKHIYSPVPDASKWEGDGAGFVRPKSGGKVKAEHIDGNNLSDLDDVDPTGIADGSVPEWDDVEKRWKMGTGGGGGESKPKLSGTASFNGTIDNTIIMTNISKTLQLEPGDVIEVTGDCNEQNKKLRTVEAVINDDEIIVNYEHAENRGNGSLKLYTESNKEITVKRLIKWYEAPLGLGQDWVDTTFKLNGVSSYFVPLTSSGNKVWTGFAEDSFGNMYACTQAAIYKQDNGIGDFYEIRNDIGFNGIAINKQTNDVFGAVYNGDIYKQTGGTGSFVSLGIGNKAWVGITMGNGYVYACVFNGGIYKINPSTGSFQDLNVGNRQYRFVSADDGYVYTGIANDCVYKILDDTKSFCAISPTKAYWLGACLTLDGGLLANSQNNAMIKIERTGGIIALPINAAHWRHVWCSSSGSIYTCLEAGSSIHVLHAVTIARQPNRFTKVKASNFSHYTKTGCVVYGGLLKELR